MKALIRVSAWQRVRLELQGQSSRGRVRVALLIGPKLAMSGDGACCRVSQARLHRRSQLNTATRPPLGWHGASLERGHVQRALPRTVRHTWRWGAIAVA